MTTARDARLSQSHIADRLDEAADLLAAQAADRFRVRAYRAAAETVRTLEEHPGEILERGGVKALVALPHVGQSIARAIDEMTTTGRWAQLDRLRGEAEPEAVFQTIPSVGERMAQRIHEALHVDTLEALEIAAHDGRLESVHGIGHRKAAAIRDSLAAMLARRRRQSPDDHEEPNVSELLVVDALYRAEGAAGRLKRIAPKRFNPDGVAWLPVMHVDREDWAYTALFSNTARAHELGREHDWVVIYFNREGKLEHQRTVVTETHGPLEGRRVVRGREADCRRWYLSGARHDDA